MKEIFCNRVEYRGLKKRKPPPERPTLAREHEAAKSAVSDAEKRLEDLLEKRAETFNAKIISQINFDIEVTRKQLEAAELATQNCLRAVSSQQAIFGDHEKGSQAILRRIAGMSIGSNDGAAFGRPCECEGLAADLDRLYRVLAEAEIKLAGPAGSSRGFYERQAERARVEIQRLESELQTVDEHAE